MFILLIAKPGYAFQYEDLQATAEGEARIQLSGPPAQELSGFVKDTKGLPIEGVRVVLSSDRTHLKYANMDFLEAVKTDEKGFFCFRVLSLASRHALTFSKKGYNLSEDLRRRWGEQYIFGHCEKPFVMEKR